jgi:hypothetical protein
VGVAPQPGPGFAQLTPFAPWTPAWVPGGKVLAGRFVSLFRNGPFRVALGVLAVKMAAMNLLPILPLNGGAIITYLVWWRKEPPENVSNAATYVGLCVSLIVMGYWLIQLAGAL